MTTDDNKALITYLIAEGLNGGNLEVADEQHFTPGYTVHIPGRTDLPAGPAAFQRVIGMYRAAFQDWHMVIEELVAEGDFVSNRFTTTGTHTGPLYGFPPTGRTMIVHGQELHRLEDGRVAETWVCDDGPSIMLQLGILPPPGPPAGAPRPPA
jgi:predicted ester cyclase